MNRHQPEALRCGNRTLPLFPPVVMGILNITPDSFSDGGRLLSGNAPDLDRVLRKAALMRRQGALIVDVGGESTRPGAQPVGQQQELDRVAPVVDAIARRIDITISVDTSTPAVMREAAALGAGMINDVRALSRPGALKTAANTDLAVCLMHMQGEPQTMQRAPSYTDVVVDVGRFLVSRAAECIAAGIEQDRIVLDPGFGFGKTLEHNLDLFRGLGTLLGNGYPVLIGVSRKAMIGTVLGRAPARRLAGALALATLAADAGVGLVRTHDVAATRDALAMVAAVRRGREGI